LLAAIACETKIESVLRERVSPEKTALVELLIAKPRDFSVAASALFSDVLAAALGRFLKKDKKVLHKKIERLFEIRNRIAHRGERPQQDEAYSVVVGARELFEWLDKTAGE